MWLKGIPSIKHKHTQKKSALEICFCPAPPPRFQSIKYAVIFNGMDQALPVGDKREWGLLYANAVALRFLLWADSVALMLIFDCVLFYNVPPNTQELW